VSAEVTLFPHFTNTSISDNPIGLRATDEEVGEAIAYKAGLSFATIPPPGAPHAAPLWVQGLYAYLNNQFNGIGNRLDGIDNRLDGIDNRFDGIDNRLDGIDNRLHGMDNRFDGIDNRLDGIDNRLDVIDNRLDGIDNRLNVVDNNVQTLRGEFVILLANSNAALDAPLYDPTLPGQWVFLAAPNPTSRDHLMTFDCE